MARSPRARNLPARQLRSTPSAVPSYYRKTQKAAKQNEVRLSSEKKDWKHATCSVCLEHPHDAVLLLCSSHNEGCRPYMCGTNYHHSNCLEQFKNAYSKEKPTYDVSTAVVPASKKPQAMELQCPLCRGDVKGWTVVEPARQYLNRKRRTCMHDGCSFVGSYKVLCKHVNSKHPSSKPREVDPVRAEEWKKFESERERQDVISTIRALNPGSVIMGDYVFERDGNRSDSFSDDSDLDDSTDSYTSSDGSDRDLFRRDHRRLGERPRRNYSIIPVGEPGIHHNDSTNAPRTWRIGFIRPLTSRRRGLVRLTHDS